MCNTHKINGFNSNNLLSLTSLHIPFSGRNVYFEQNVIAARPHILLFSKPDLADLSEKDFICDYYKARGVSKILFANCAKQVDSTIKRKVSYMT